MSASQLTGGADGARLEVRISRLMVLGVYLAMVFLAVGIVLSMVQGIDPLNQPMTAFPGPAEILGLIMALEPAGFLWAGIVIVIAIPIGRVVVSGIGFLAAGERRFALISLLVLLVVLVSILAALNLEG